MVSSRDQRVGKNGVLSTLKRYDNTFVKNFNKIAVFGHRSMCFEERVVVGRG